MKRITSKFVLLFLIRNLSFEDFSAVRGGRRKNIRMFLQLDNRMEEFSFESIGEKCSEMI